MLPRFFFRQNKHILEWNYLLIYGSFKALFENLGGTSILPVLPYGYAPAESPSSSSWFLLLLIQGRMKWRNPRLALYDMYPWLCNRVGWKNFHYTKWKLLLWVLWTVDPLNSLINKQTKINEYGGKIFLFITWNMRVWWNFFFIFYMKKWKYFGKKL